jgi:hypothetical protein
MIRNRVYDYLSGKNKSMLCVGPMSKNCVDESIYLANTFHLPISLIASRRQIECKELGGGYVENWTTDKFIEYVRARDTGRNIILSRDHGGPWQHPCEVKLNLRDAMESSKKSYACDIESGMEIIHIDPSIDPKGTPSPEQLLDRVFELYEFCWAHARARNKDIAFEVGTEEQDVHINSIDDFEYLLSEICKRCKKMKLPQPLFVVGQTGTKVMEIENVGEFGKCSFNDDAFQLRQLTELCGRYNVLFKEHNADYLSDEVLRLHPQMGVHGVNVAPEFGVVETKTFIEIMKKLNLKRELHDFINLSYGSMKWEKWMKENSQATNHDRAVISGHYVFGKPEFKEIKMKVSHHLKKLGDDLDQKLREAIRKSILRYIDCLNLANTAQGGDTKDGIPA